MTAEQTRSLIAQCILGLAVAAAAIAWIVMPLVHETQCAGIRAEWHFGVYGPPPVHVVTTADGTVVNDQYSYPQHPNNALQISADAQARYSAMGCTVPIDKYP
jgi:hypothetical protein